ncbi:MAG TPA: hypothetical protein VEC37_18690 [Bacillota bacterium]|nr:hypothetical protein [Bacillota bacterium]
MRTVNLTEINKLESMLLEEDPEYQDIGILDSNGKVLGVIIPEGLYQFLLEKVEEAEDEIDLQRAMDRENDPEFQKEREAVLKEAREKG